MYRWRKRKDIKAIAKEHARDCPYYTQRQSILEAQWWPNKLNLRPLVRNRDRGESVPSACMARGQGWRGRWSQDVKRLDLGMEHSLWRDCPMKRLVEDLHASPIVYADV